VQQSDLGPNGHVDLVRPEAAPPAVKLAGGRSSRGRAAPGPRLRSMMCKRVGWSMPWSAGKRKRWPKTLFAEHGLLSLETHARFIRAHRRAH
jgi:hypothetical protein